jgi:hypothetical protein
MLPIWAKRIPGTALRLGILLLVCGNSSAQGQTWISTVGVVTTTDSAKITWTTAVPSDSQVEYGPSALYGNVSPLAPALVLVRSITLTGLTAGTTYHFRVRGRDSGGILVVGADNTFTIAAPVTISISPQSATVNSGGTQQFTSTVANSSSQAVSWYTSAGTISSSGLFTAPKVSATTTAVISVVSVANSSKWTNAHVTVQPGAAISVSISPASASVASGARQQFAATVSNASNPQVTWSASPGSITTTGLYTAPTVSSAATAAVTATSQADPTRKAISAVQITPPPAPVQHSVLLSWNPAASQTVSYRMYRSTISGSSYGLLASAISGTSYTDQTVQPGTAYYYVVTAVDAAGRESGYSNQIKATIP